MDKVNLHQVFNKIPENQPQNNNKEEYKPNYESTYQQFSKILNQTQINYQELKQLAWNGVPPLFRSLVWKLVLDYMPTNKLNSEEVLKRKREEYFTYVNMYHIPMEELDENEKNMRKIVLKDVPRTQPNYEIFKHPRIQQMLERILYIWNIRHPACGYVQGMNEIVTPLIVIFLQDFVELDQKIYEIPDNIHKVKREEWDIVEADSYWCLSRILDKIQDNYTNGQPGIKKSLDKMQQIVGKLDPQLCEHFKNQNVEFVHFAFRWILCLLIREFQLPQILRLFDTYLSDDKGFQILAIYVCASVVLKFSHELKKKKFNDIITFLQNMPTKDWSIRDLEMVLSQAFVYSSKFELSQGHIKQSDNLQW